MNDKKKIIFTAIAVSIVGLVTGLFLGGDLLPSQAENRQYAEETTSTKTETIVVEHSHDGLPPHKHIVKTITETTETTPHGDFHDFAATIASGTTSMPTTLPPTIMPPTTPPLTTPPPTIPSPIAPPPTTPLVASPTIAVTGLDKVWVLSREFRPRVISVPVGTEVTWISMASVTHTVTSDNGTFDGILESGGSFSYAFTERGTFSYYCQPHTQMQGTIYVE